MGRTWSEAAREKLDKELDLYLDASLFISKFQRNDVLSVAWDNIIAVMKDLKQIMLDNHQQQKDDDVSLIINEHRLKVENQLLQYIGDSHVSHYNKEAFQEILLNFKSKQADLNAAADNDATGTSQNKGEASQLTKIELQQQKDDEEKLNICMDKQDAVTKFIRDYQKTVQFMERFVLTKLVPEIETVLDDAFSNISDGYHFLHNIYGYDEEDKWYHLDVPQLINEYKSKLETELQEICDKVSDPAIKEAFSHHLTEVTAQVNSSSFSFFAFTCFLCFLLIDVAS
ncbi:hypothetical protein Tco_0578600 [Tanacetum coccineum]